MKPSEINWKSAKSVYAYVKSLSKHNGLILYWNGYQYELGKLSWEESIKAKGYGIICTFPATSSKQDQDDGDGVPVEIPT